MWTLRQGTQRVEAASECLERLSTPPSVFRAECRSVHADFGRTAFRGMGECGKRALAGVLAPAGVSLCKDSILGTSHQGRGHTERIMS